MTSTKEYQRSYYKNNKDKYRKYIKTYRQKHPEKCRKYSRDYYHKNKKRISKRRRDYYKENKDKINKYRREWRKLNGDSKHDRERNLKHKYNLSIEDYDKMFIEQQGCCAICGQQQKDRKLSVDHNHKTGKVRGLLCISCNRLVGEIESGKAEKAKEYLTKSSI